MEMFEPNLTLTCEPDGEYTLHSVTLTPHSCYIGGLAEAGVPANVRLTDDIFSVLLHIQAQTTALCLPAIKAIKHTLRDLKLGPGTSKTRVAAFMMLGDTIVGMSQIEAGSFQQVAATGGVVDTADWFAWVNETIPAQRSFHVLGSVLLPTPGFQAVLELASPQGVNPHELILKVVVVPKPGIWPQHVTPVHVHFDRAPYHDDYTGVLIRLPNGDAVHLPVEKVH